jgi:hypothetical protein
MRKGVNEEMLNEEMRELENEFSKSLGSVII